MYKHIPQEYNSNGTLKHVIKEGARYHVKYYDSLRIHCTEKNCEINKKGN